MEQGNWREARTEMGGHRNINFKLMAGEKEADDFAKRRVKREETEDLECRP